MFRNGIEELTVALLHGMISGGASPDEKTIDAAIKGATLLESKLAALRPPEEVETPEVPAPTPATTDPVKPPAI